MRGAVIRTDLFLLKSQLRQDETDGARLALNNPKLLIKMPKVSKGLRRQQQQNTLHLWNNRTRADAAATPATGEGAPALKRLGFPSLHPPHASAIHPVRPSRVPPASLVQNHPSRALPNPRIGSAIPGHPGRQHCSMAANGRRASILTKPGWTTSEMRAGQLTRGTRGKKEDGTLQLRLVVEGDWRRVERDGRF